MQIVKRDETNMNNDLLYQEHFEALYNTIAQNKNNFEAAQQVYFATPLHILGDSNGSIYNTINLGSQRSIQTQSCLLFKQLAAKCNPKLKNVSNDNTLDDLTIFTKTENKETILYKLITSPYAIIKNYSNLLEKYNAQKIYAFSLHTITDNDEVGTTWKREAMRRQNGNVKYISIIDLFDEFGTQEHKTYIKYLFEFNAKIQKLIGYSTIVKPSEESLIKFKEDRLQYIINYNYNINDYPNIKRQIEILKGNFIQRGLYLNLLNDTLFSESYISAEWYYYNFANIEGIEQTATIVGYLKSVEQLLYKITMLHINDDQQTRTLRSTEKYRKEEGNKPYARLTSANLKNGYLDTTLGSLIKYLGYNKNNDLWNVDELAQKEIATILNEYRDKCRNELLHIDNIYRAEDIEKIRSKVYLIYFLVLGGCKIPNKETLI